MTQEAIRPGAEAPSHLHCGTSGESCDAAVKSPLHRPSAVLDCRSFELFPPLVLVAVAGLSLGLAGLRVIESFRVVSAGLGPGG
jgi:hypothetical protein